MFGVSTIVMALFGVTYGMQCHSRHYDQLVDQSNGQQWSEVFPEGQNQYNAERQCTLHDDDRGMCSTIIVTDKLADHSSSQQWNVVTLASVKQTCCDPVTDPYASPSWACDRRGLRLQQRKHGGTLSVRCENTGGFVRKMVIFDCEQPHCELSQREWSGYSDMYWEQCG